MTGLLVSVRSAEEGEAALAGGAALIDVKEPEAGSLGRATDAAIRAVVQRVNGRRAVSAAMGELRDPTPVFAGDGLAFVKWGLSDCRTHDGWREELITAAEEIRQRCPRSQPVAVAYADWQSARSPHPDLVCAFACDNGWPFLLDTWTKTGQTLLNWLTGPTVRRFCDRCRAADVRVALAGSLGVREIETLRACEPDWFAVRTAVCRGGRREGAVDVARVRHLADILRGRATSIRVL